MKIYKVYSKSYHRIFQGFTNTERRLLHKPKISQRSNNQPTKTQVTSRIQLVKGSQCWTL
ncbi:MAG: hypothetical protein ACJA1O_003560, partial [Spirosomataceae bacterium]